MNSRLAECIPNFSEARRMEVVDQIVSAIQSVKGVIILDRHSDIDHNRTVITMIGEPEVIKEAAFRAIATSAELIDMNQHTGAHPRIGATDVIPFIPIRGLTIKDCVEFARQLGSRVGAELKIPVYLYEEAATCPERVNLEKIRKGQYEELKKFIQSDPKRKPDYGPSEVGKAGAVIIGAREPLIAFNVFLTTDDTEIAKKIARTIRHSSGGLRFVKAMGVCVDGRAQVSMNLTDFKRTSIPLVIETIRREAQRYGTLIHHSELVGLIPQDALIDTAVWYTQLDGFEKGHVLENKLREIEEQDITPKFQFLDELASAEPTPGGGSAAAFTAAEAAALISMVAGLTIGKEKYAEVQVQMENILNEATKLRTNLETAISDDANAFSAVLNAFQLPKTNEEEKTIRKDAIHAALVKAAETPLRTAELALSIMQLAKEVAEKGNLSATTDAGTAAALSLAAISSAGANVRVNLKDYQEDTTTNNILGALKTIEERALDLYSLIKEVIKDRSGISML